jgi:NAD(P)H-hydrate repair Nnr-like enzyme with NAD(P)H-hydrate dehydratase domain
MMIIAGTVPIKEIPLIHGEVTADGDFLVVDGHRIPRTQGTGIMLSAALATTTYLKLNSPRAMLAGDIGMGDGSRAIYEYLIENVAALSPEVLALHYWLPDMALSRRLIESVKACTERPVLIADAASMYSAKAAGLASEFDVFTPDATEMAFLADPYATHPAYISKHLFDTDITKTPELILTAYQNRSAAKLLLVKGAVDYIVRGGNVVALISDPDVPEMEAIGGTGDTITGLVAAFIYAGLEPHEAAIIAARTNRMAGKYAKVTPATKVMDIVDWFPAVFAEHLCEWSGVCTMEKGGYTT